jgi:hypothetical protein
LHCRHHTSSDGRPPWNGIGEGGSSLSGPSAYQADGLREVLIGGAAMLLRPSLTGSLRAQVVYLAAGSRLKHWMLHDEQDVRSN